MKKYIINNYYLNKYDYPLYIYFSFNEWLTDYINIWKNDGNIDIFYDDMNDFIVWFIHILKINGLNKNDKISLHCYDDKFVLYTNNKKYEYFYGWS